jgi:chromosome segregation ATPase
VRRGQELNALPLQAREALERLMVAADGATADLDALQRINGELEEHVGTARQEAEGRLQALRALDVDMQRLREELAQATAARAARDAELETLRQEAEGRLQALRAMDGDMQRLREELAQATAARAARDAELETLRQEVQAKGHELQNNLGQAAAAGAEVATLRHLVGELQGRAEAADHHEHEVWRRRWRCLARLSWTRW